ncbi:MAG: hypothetical protein V4524_03495 [Patescibacteria group bacterium]
MSEAQVTEEFQKIEGAMLAFLDTLGKDDRLARIDDLLHRLNFERRLTALTDEERDHMNDESLSPEARQKLDEAKTEAERENLITMYARSTYFRQCAWKDYLNGTTNEKPFCSATK